MIVATGDLRGLPSQTIKKLLDASEVELAPGLSEDTLWQLEVIRQGHQIPGGGLLMFDSEIDRRMVAIYGHPSTSSLGVLGEQGAQEGADRLQSIAQGYDADGAVILPTFEIIATVASAGPGSDGDYSAMTARDVIRPVDRDRRRQRHLCGAGSPVGAKRLLVAGERSTRSSYSSPTFVWLWIPSGGSSPTRYTYSRDRHSGRGRD